MTGRSEAVDLIMATQRGTATMTWGSVDLKSQCALRIGLGVAKADAQLIIPDDVRIGADLARLLTAPPPQAAPPVVGIARRRMRCSGGLVELMPLAAHDSGIP
jgi:hypothetical protein